MQPLTQQEESRARFGGGLRPKGKSRQVLQGHCSDDTTARAAGMCTKRLEVATKGSTDGPLGYCLVERTGFLIGRDLWTVVMV